MFLECHVQKKNKKKERKKQDEFCDNGSESAYLITEFSVSLCEFTDPNMLQ
jgi:hypothetical protein